MSKTLSHLQLDLEWTIAATRDRVWKALTEEVGEWWPRDFYVNSDATFRLEPRLGGFLFEDLGDGAGFAWFQVTGFMPPNQLLLRGEISPPFGGPATSLLKWSLTEVEANDIVANDAAATQLALTDCLFGVLDSKQQDSLSEGWEHIFGSCFKPFVESTRA